MTLVQYVEIILVQPMLYDQSLLHAAFLLLFFSSAIIVSNTVKVFNTMTDDSVLWFKKQHLRTECRFLYFLRYATLVSSPFILYNFWL